MSCEFYFQTLEYTVLKIIKFWKLIWQFQNSTKLSPLRRLHILLSRIMIKIRTYFLRYKNTRILSSQLGNTFLLRTIRTNYSELQVQRSLRDRYSSFTDSWKCHDSAPGGSTLQAAASIQTPIYIDRDAASIQEFNMVSSGRIKSR